MQSKTGKFATERLIFGVTGPPKHAFGAYSR